jgi:hypothetical protein
MCWMEARSFALGQSVNMCTSRPPLCVCAAAFLSLWHTARRHTYYEDVFHSTDAARCSNSAAATDAAARSLGLKTPQLRTQTGDPARTWPCACVQCHWWTRRERHGAQTPSRGCRPTDIRTGTWQLPKLAWQPCLEALLRRGWACGGPCGRAW